jgi:arylsulfatase A-like enzyme
MIALATALAPAAPAAKPNIAFFLTDDQDQMLGGSFPTLNGATPMPQTRSLLAEQGATAGNFFVHTPICCPSRSELLTGKYFHNLKVDPTRESKQAEDCMHINVRRRAAATAATPRAQ